MLTIYYLQGESEICSESLFPNMSDILFESTMIEGGIAAGAITVRGFMVKTSSRLCVLFMMYLLVGLLMWSNLRTYNPLLSKLFVTSSLQSIDSFGSFTSGNMTSLPKKSWQCRRNLYNFITKFLKRNDFVLNK